MARTYKRDSRGRFAGGGGSSGGGKSSAKPKASGKAKAKPKASPKPKAKAKPATGGKPSGGGRKRNKSFVTTTGTFATRIRAKLAQKERTKRFSSKATGPGRDAKAEYKKRAGEARKAAKTAPVAIKKTKTRIRVKTDSRQVIAKPKNLKRGAVAESMARRALAEIKKADAAEKRAEANGSRLRSQLSDAVYSLTSNPYSKQKRAANQERKSRQRRVDWLQSRLNRQYAAAATHRLRSNQAYNRYKEVRMSQRRTASLSGVRRPRTFQRNIFGGADYS